MPLFINLRASSIENGWLPNFPPLNLGSSTCSISFVNRHPLSPKTHRKAGLCGDDIIWLRYNDGRRPFILEQDNRVNEDTILISDTARGNIGLQNGDRVCLFERETPFVSALQWLDKYIILI